VSYYLDCLFICQWCMGVPPLNDVRCMIYDVWGMMYDVWCMMYDAWGMKYDAWCMMYDVWCLTRWSWWWWWWCTIWRCPRCFRSGHGAILKAQLPHFPPLPPTSYIMHRTYIHHTLYIIHHTSHIIHHTSIIYHTSHIDIIPMLVFLRLWCTTAGGRMMVMTWI